MPLTIDRAASADVLIAPHTPEPEPPPDVPPDEDDDDAGDVGADGEALLFPPQADTATRPAHVSAVKVNRMNDGTIICQQAFLSVPAPAGAGSTVVAPAIRGRFHSSTAGVRSKHPSPLDGPAARLTAAGAAN